MLVFINIVTQKLYIILWIFMDNISTNYKTIWKRKTKKKSYTHKFMPILSAKYFETY